MPAIPKKLLRSLPTLTEVVTPPLLSDPVPAVDMQPPLLDSDAIIERVLQRLDLSLEDKVRSVIETLVEEHIREVEPRLKQKVGVAVRAAVSKAVAAEVKEQQAKAK
jgi:hypothetical protein